MEVSSFPLVTDALWYKNGCLLPHKDEAGEFPRIPLFSVFGDVSRAMEVDGGTLQRGVVRVCRIALATQVG